MKIYIGETMYAFKHYHDFLVKPSPKTVYEIDTEDIEEFFILLFSKLNQFPLYVTFEWYDDDFDGMKKELDKLDVVYSHRFIPQKSAYKLTEYGDFYFDILIFTVEVTNKNQLTEIIHKSLIPYHLFIISNQNNVTFGERYYQDDSVQFEINDSTTFCKMQHDISATFLVTNQFENMNDLLSSLPQEIEVQEVEIVTEEE